MKYILILSMIFISACSGRSSDDTMTDIEICLDQGGEWQGECAFPNEYCRVRAQCKPESEFCPCIDWHAKD